MPVILKSILFRLKIYNVFFYENYITKASRPNERKAFLTYINVAEHLQSCN